jgi:hypothetical protein
MQAYIAHDGIELRCWYIASCSTFSIGEVVKTGSLDAAAEIRYGTAARRPEPMHLR